MSVITLQFGQCGNQVGESLSSFLIQDILNNGQTPNSISLLNDDYAIDAINRWFHINEKEEWESRSILIDAECKVTDSCKNLFNKPECIISKSYGGSANNWAFGYSIQEKRMHNEILDAVRCQIERSNYSTSFLSILSAGGGTGSGVGCKVVEILRDEYPNKTKVNAVILPFKNGEIVTQNYNSLLTLSKLYTITDATILFENDLLHHICAKTFSLENIRFCDFNSIIAQQLGGILQPIEKVSLPSIVRDLTAHPDYKFIQTRSSPLVLKDYLQYETQNSWKTLMNDAGMSLKAINSLGKMRNLKCIGNMVISRGDTNPSNNEIQCIRDNLKAVSWLPSEMAMRTYYQRRCFKDFQKFVSIISNNNSASVALSFILNDVKNILSSGAYVHHYKKYDVNEADFHEAVEGLEDICRNYFML